MVRKRKSKPDAAAASTSNAASTLNSSGSITRDKAKPRKDPLQILDDQVKFVNNIASTQINKLRATGRVHGVQVIRYKIDDYSTRKSYYKGSIKFDSDDEEMEATFFKYKKADEAKRIFGDAQELNGDGILKPWFLTHREDDDTWIICYEKFDFLLSKEKPLELTKDESWKISVRNSMRTVKYIHKCQRLHGGLGKPCNYAVIINPKNRAFALKILFTRSCSDDQSVKPTDDDFLKDWTDYRDVLKSTILISLATSDESASFFAFFDKTYGKFRTEKELVEQLLCHPYLNTVDSHLQYLMEFYHKMAVAEELRRFLDFINAAGADEFNVGGDWFCKLTPYLLHLLDRDKESLIDGTYDKTDVKDLIRFFRHRGIHDKGTNFIRSCDEAKASFPNLCNQLHRYL